MDYAYAPGITPYDTEMLAMLSHLPDTTIVRYTQARTVTNLIEYLNALPAASKPIGKVIISSHGNESGYMNVWLVEEETASGPRLRNTNFDYLLYAEANNLGRMDAGLQAPPPGELWIKGCKIGKAVPVLQKLRQVLGGSPVISAPKMFQNIVPVPSGTGHIESLSYDFTVAQPTQYANRDALITALSTAGLTLIDGNPVPAANWGIWLPRDVSVGRRQISINVTLNPGILIAPGNTLTRIRLGYAEAFRHDLQTVIYSKAAWPGPLPSDQPGKIAALRTLLLADPKYDIAQRPFPVYMEYELSGIDPFVNGFTWEITFENGTFRAVGTRHKYTVTVPICDPAQPNNRLIFNFIPSPYNAATAHYGLLHTDARMYSIIS
jgi:hypothetical protein